MHEFLITSPVDAAATNGFVAAMISRLMNLSGVCVWISTAGTIYPGALKSFGVDPEKIIFIDLKKERDVLYAMEEALKCNRVTAVLGEIQNITFKESRRFQLAAEQSRVTGFILRNNIQSINNIACVSRWRITSLKSQLPEDMPGVGFPRWHVELLKVRNGFPGKWNIEWSSNTFNEIKPAIKEIDYKEIRKIG